MDLIKEVKNLLGISQPMLAQLLGVGLPLLKQAETGRRRLPPQARYRVAEMLEWLQARRGTAEQMPVPAMDAAWKQRQIRTLEAKLKTLEVAIENENEALLEAQRQADLAAYIQEKPGGVDLEQERMARERLAHFALMRLSSPKRQAVYWELQLKREAIRAQLRVLHGESGLSGRNKSA